jgi:hypothetical protein
MEKVLLDDVIATLMSLRHTYGNIPVVMHCYDDDGHILGESKPDFDIVGPDYVVDNNKWGVPLMDEERLVIS